MAASRWNSGSNAGQRLVFQSGEAGLQPLSLVAPAPANLRGFEDLSVARDFLLFGNLAHDLIEDFFLQADALAFDGMAFEQWFDATFARLVEEEGAVLLMPGRRSDLEGFRIKLKRAVTEIRQYLANANVTKVVPEMHLEGIYSGGNLTGFADLVLEKGDGKPGSDRYEMVRRKEISLEAGG